MKLADALVQLGNAHVPTCEARWSCNVCGARDVMTRVAARGASESVVAWMEGVTHALAAAHARRSPQCRTLTLADVRIRMNDGGRIGDATPQIP